MRGFSRKRALLFLVCLLAASGAASGQESILYSYKRNFVKAGLSMKSTIIKDAALDDKSGEFLGELAEFALRFALDGGDILRDDPDMIALVGAAAESAAKGSRRESAKTLWELFLIYQDSHSRVEILDALAVLGRGNPEVAGNLNRFLAEKNRSFLGGEVQDFPVTEACVKALGLLGDSSSFPVLFSAMMAAYPRSLAREILKSLDSVQGNYKDFLADVIRGNSFPEKAAAFRLGAYNEKLSPAERGELAVSALEVSLENAESEMELLSAVSLRYDAVILLTRLKWTPASPLALRNFYKVQADSAKGAVSPVRLLEAVACLGAMGTAEAAQAIALQLGVLNSRMETSNDYDETVILALIAALGELADKSAFDYLLHVGYLNYPEKIQAAAREALNRLKW